jgi:hypothetical protein
MNDKSWGREGPRSRVHQRDERRECEEAGDPNPNRWFAIAEPEVCNLYELLEKLRHVESEYRLLTKAAQMWTSI